MQKIAVINASSVLSDSAVANAVADIQIQITRDFAPAWGVDAELIPVPTGVMPAPDAWWLVVLDNTDVAAALGYHDITPTGMPLGKAFAKTDLETDHLWSVTVSHEILEMLGDPWMNRLGFDVSDVTRPAFYNYEICDACEDESFAYKINDTTVSDFVYPAWFDAGRSPNGQKLDHRGLISAPFQLLNGGFIGIYDLKTGWSQLNAPPVNGTAKAKSWKPRQIDAPPGSRRERRLRKTLGFPLQPSMPVPDISERIFNISLTASVIALAATGRAMSVGP